MDTEKTMRFKKPEAIEKTTTETHIHKDVRLWLAVILAVTLLYITAATYPVLW
ncbi:MAG: hypothetical protein KDC24_08440 [Saprospiraceae bacterium]|nr:hypothetical protein [Saprospiraceae bacterium]